MAKKVYEEQNIKNIADAIRNKLKTQDTYKVNEMAAAIESIVGETSSDIYKVSSVEEMEKADAKENDICLIYSNNITSITQDSVFKNITAEPTVILTQLPEPFSSVVFHSSAGDSLDFFFFLGAFYVDCTSKKSNKSISIEYAVETLADGTIKCTRNCTDDLAQVEFLEDLTLFSKDTGEWEEWSLFFSTGSVNFEGIYTYTQNNEWEYLNIGLETNPLDLLKNKKAYSSKGVVTGEFGTMSTAQEYLDVNDMLLTAQTGSAPLTNIAYMFKDYKETELPIVEYMNTQAVTNAYGAFYNCMNVKELNISDWKTDNIQDASYLFYNCKNLNNLDLSNWNTSNIQGINNGFYNCWNLKELNLSNWNLSNVNDNIKTLFFNCKNLSNLNMFNWNICNTSTLNNTFAHCENLKELNVSNWNTDSLTKMMGTFMWCNNITNLDLSDWNTNNVTHWYSAFSYCNNLQNINVDMESAKYLDSAFSFCNSIKDFNFLSNIRNLSTACSTFKNSTINDFNNVFNTLIISQSNNLSNVVRCFENAKIDTTTLSYENLTFPNLTSGYSLLYGTNIENVYLNNISCPNMTSLGYAIGNYKQIRDLYIQNIYAPNASIFNSSIFNELKQNIVNIKFEDCIFGNKTGNSLVNSFRNSNTLSSFYWKNIQGINNNFLSLSNAFANCPNLKNVYIDLNWGAINSFNYHSIINNSNNVQDLTIENITCAIHYSGSAPFSGSIGLDNTNINLLNWIMTNNYVMDFKNVNGGNWNLYNWNLSNVTESKNVFWNFNANTLELTDWDISNSTNFYSMFRNTQVNSLNISNWIMPQNKDYVSFSLMFNNCHSLNPQQIENWNLSGIKNIDFHAMFGDAMDPFEEPETPLELEDWHFNLSNWNVQGEASLSSMFSGYSNRNIYINLTGWNPKLKGWLDQVFHHNNICQLDGIENWDTSNITYMQSVFGDISRLEKLNLSQWNIENVGEISYLTPLCQYLDVSNWRFSNLEGNYNKIFSPKSGYGSSSADTSNATLIADNWDFCDKEINNLSYVFWGLGNINYLSLKNWKGLNNCNSLSYLVGDNVIVNTLDISNWNLSNTSDVTNAFYFLNNCQPNIIIDGFHIKEMKGMSQMIPAPGFRGGAVIDEIDYSKAVLEDNYFTTITETTNVNLDGVITNNITKIGLVTWRDQLILNNCDFSSVINPGTWNPYSYYDNNGNKDVIGGFYNLGKGYTVQQEEYPDYTLNLPSKLSYNGLRNIAESIYNLYETYDVANGGTLYKQRIYCNTNLSYWSNMPADVKTMFAEKGWLFTYMNQ